MAGSGGAAGGAVGTSGTAATSYNLDGEAAKLSPHANHRVEITGQVQASAGLGAGAASATPTLKVESVKMISETCAPSATTPGRAPQPRPEAPAPAPVKPPQQ